MTRYNIQDFFITVCHNSVKGKQVYLLAYFANLICIHEGSKRCSSSYSDIVRFINIHLWDNTENNIRWCK